MEQRTHEQPERADSAERAAEWLERLKHGGAAEKGAFLRWLKRSPQNVGETLLATSTDVILRKHFESRRIDIEREISTDNVVHMTAPLASNESMPEARWRKWSKRVGLGFASAATTLVVVLLLMESAALSDWWHQKEYVTAIGEQRTIELSDGSSVSINTASRVRVIYSKDARDVILHDGQALFNVAKDPERPFRVRVGGSVVQAVGTKFDVRRRSGHTQVAVAEGTVRIGRDLTRKRGATLDTQSNIATLTAGEAIRILGPGNVDAPVPVRIAEIGLWQQRRLLFADTTLAEIADEFARYNRRPHIRIEGETLRARRLSGVFDADSPEALLLFFTADESVDVQRNDDEIVIRPRL